MLQSNQFIRLSQVSFGRMMVQILYHNYINIKSYQVLYGQETPKVTFYILGSTNVQVADIKLMTRGGYITTSSLEFLN